MESCQYPEEWLHIKEEYCLWIEEKWQIKNGKGLLRATKGKQLCKAMYILDPEGHDS